jgi:type III pantothenate kinase
MNLLAVSIGNTRTRVGAFIDGKLAETATLANQPNVDVTAAIDHAYGPLKGRGETTVLLSSVEPTRTEAIESALARHLGQKVLHVEKDLSIPVGRQLDREAMVGEDRLLNAAAAFDVMQQACVVVDAGTAITVDFVDGAGTFHGGAIAPGGQLMLDALNQRAAQLPEIEFAKPDECMGHNTVEAMRAGVFYGLRGMVRELVELFAEQVGHFPTVIATGGDGALLFKDYELVDRVVPDLTLMGLNVTYRKAREAQDAEG